MMVKVYYTKKFVEGKFAGTSIRECMSMDKMLVQKFIDRAGLIETDLTGNKYRIGDIDIL